MDSDESYLLKSYNENEQLFSNLPIHNHNQFPSSNNQKRSRKKTNDHEKSCSLVDDSYDNIGFKRVLDSICEVFVGDEKSATKTAPRKNGNHVNEIMINKNRGEKSSNMKSKSRKHRNSEVMVDKEVKREINFSKSERKRKEKDEEEELVEMEELKEALSKLDQKQKLFKIQTFLNEFCEKYNQLVAKLEQYETLTEQMEEIIMSQQKFIQTETKQALFCLQKVENYIKYESPNFSSFIGEFNHNLNMAEESISHIIRNFLFGKAKNNTSSTQSSTSHIRTTPFTKLLLPNKEEFIDTVNTQEIGIQVYEEKEIAVHSNAKVHLKHHTNEQEDSEKLFYYKKFIKDSGEVQNKGGQMKLVSVSNFLSNFKNEEVAKEEETNEGFRKLANFRLKQLENENEKQENIIKSLNAKVFVIRNENKELKEIIEGLIGEMSKQNIRLIGTTLNLN